jgi:hypothetical protein
VTSGLACDGQPAGAVIGWRSMKRTAETTEIDELRPEYQRSDFDELVRGKYRHGRSAEAIKDESSARPRHS